MNIMCNFSESVEKILKDTFQRWNMDWDKIDFAVIPYESKMTDLPISFNGHDIVLRIMKEKIHDIDAENFDSWLGSGKLIYAMAHNDYKENRDFMLTISVNSLLDIAKDIRDKIMV